MRKTKNQMVLLKCIASCDGRKVVTVDDFETLKSLWNICEV